MEFAALLACGEGAVISHRSAECADCFTPRDSRSQDATAASLA
jgi:hypothetical protein